MRRWSSLLPALVLLGCSDHNGQPEAEQGLPGPRDLGPLPSLSCQPDGSDCRDFVISRLLLPMTAADTQRWGLQLGGQVHNQLGSILSALASMGPSMTLQETVDGALFSGSTIVLARVQASDFAADANTVGQTWVGAKTSCCPAAAGDRLKCRQEAEQGCFAGDPPHEFAVEPTASQSELLRGSLSSGKLLLGARTLRINLPLTSSGVMALNLRSVQLRGRLEGKTISDGALAGTITRSEVESELIPSVAALLEETLADPAMTTEVKDFLATLFDRNKDGKISPAEVAESSIKSLLEGEVDSDGDGEKELSLGIGFQAVAAVIKGK